MVTTRRIISQKGDAFLVVLAAALVSGCSSTSTDGNHSPAGGTGEGSGSTGQAAGACGAGGAAGGPLDLFPCDSYWYKDVTAAQVAAESASIIASIGSWGTGDFRIDFSFHFMHASGTDPRVTFTLDEPTESDRDPVPIPPNGALEGEEGYTCTQGGDCHLLVIDDSTKKLFEVYSANSTGGKWTGYAQAVWDLSKAYGPQGRGYGCTSADAAGLPITPGLIGVRETLAGEIKHALRFILPNEKIRKGPSFVFPATHGTSATQSADGPPYGARLRLKSGFDEAKISSKAGKAIVRALKTYGMILADAGNLPLTAEDDLLQKRADPKMTWDGNLTARDISSIKPSDFEVLELGTMRTDNDCVLTK